MQLIVIKTDLVTQVFTSGPSLNLPEKNSQESRRSFLTVVRISEPGTYVRTIRGAMHSSCLDFVGD